MYTRVVRFTGVSEERMNQLQARIEESDGPPPGINSSGLSVLFDADQGTAVVLQHFASRADLDEAAKVFEAMDASDTPGTRVSVDACEVKLELQA
jgi:hypothetical protein